MIFKSPYFETNTEDIVPKLVEFSVRINFHFINSARNFVL